MCTVEIKIGTEEVVGSCACEFEETLKLVMEEMGKMPESELQPGCSISVGMIVYHLLEDEDNYFVVAPDFTKDAMQDVTSDLSLAMKIHGEQVSMAEKIGYEMSEVPFYFGLLYTEGVFQEEKIYLERAEGETETDSGWLILPEIQKDQQIDPDKIRVLQLFELLQECPSLLPVISMPVDYSCVVVRGNLVAVINEFGDNLLRK